MNEEKSYPKVMLVSNHRQDTPQKRVVFMEKNGKYLAWTGAETLEEAEGELGVYNWKYAKDIEEPVELTMDEIAEKFGVDVTRLKIKK